MDHRTGEPAALAEDIHPGHARRTVLAIVAVLAYQGFVTSILGVGAPWIARSFALTDARIAALFAWISLSSLGALVLSRVADRVGRRRVLIWCMLATPLSALGAALSTDLVWFAICEIALYAFMGATVAACVVMLAEALPIAARAKGQSYGGLATGLGGGLCVVLMPVLVQTGYSWRWLLAIAATGLAGVPLVARRVPESERWRRAAASGVTQRRLLEVFAPRYRRRAVPIMISSLLGAIATAAASSWSYFHSVTVVGLPATVVSTMILIGGGAGMLGFPLGAWCCERFGRVSTVVVFGLCSAAGALVFYWGPPSGFASPALWLGAGFAWFTGAGNASMVGGNSAATELFPTALRGTMIGWFVLIAAIGSVSAQGAIAVLAAPLGGLSNVVGYLALLGMPGVVIFGLFVEETRGLSLEAAAGEIDG